MLEVRLGSGNVIVHNRGIGGDSTPRVLARLKTDVLDIKPDIVVLLVGGNDAAPDQSVPKATTAANLDKIIASVRNYGGKILLLQYHVIINPEKPEKMWAHLDSNNGLIAEVAAKNNVPVLDMSVPMKNGLKRHPLSEIVNTEDGVHLSPAGELIYAREVFWKLDELGWVK